MEMKGRHCGKRRVNCGGLLKFTIFRGEVFCVFFADNNGTVSCEHAEKTISFPIVVEGVPASAQLTPSRSGNAFQVSLIGSTNEATDRVVFKYKPYHFDTADINRDGKTDILIGLIKATQFDPVEKRRLFILRIDEGKLRPLWLGSKVCQDLIDFKTGTNGIVTTLEKTKSGNYAIGEYSWRSFGLTLNRYLQNEISLHDATKIFSN